MLRILNIQRTFWQIFGFMQNIRFAFFAEHNPVRHISDLASNDNKYHQEEEKDEDGNE